MDCSVCYNPIIDKVLMTCTSQHQFCFKCLLKNVEANLELKSCPNCRGGDKFIMLTNETESEDTGFYSLKYFKKSLPILKKILGDSVINSCLISEIILVYYVKNKKQLDIAHKLIIDNNMDDIIPFIKWNKKRSFVEIDMTLPTLPTTPSPNEQTSAREQREQREQIDQRDRSRIIFDGSHNSDFIRSFFGNEND